MLDDVSLLPTPHEDAATDAGTAGSEIEPPPEVPSTRTATKILTEDIGWDRGRARYLHHQYDDLHQRSHFVEWRTLTSERARVGIANLLDELAALGFAWRDIARLVGVSVPAVQKWRRGESASGESRGKVASLLAACDLIAEHYLVEDLGTWFEVPIVVGVPITPIDMYAAERADSVFEFASGHTDPEQILTDFDPEWRERFRSDFEVYRSGDGELSIRPRDMR